MLSRTSCNFLNRLHNQKVEKHVFQQQNTFARVYLYARRDLRMDNRNDDHVIISLLSNSEKRNISHNPTIFNAPCYFFLF